MTWWDSKHLQQQRVELKKLEAQISCVSPNPLYILSRQPLAGGPSIGGLSPNVKERLLNSLKSHQVSKQSWEKKILSTHTIRAGDFKILLKVYSMATSEPLPNVMALLNTGANSNIINFQ